MNAIAGCAGCGCFGEHPSGRVDSRELRSGCHSSRRLLSGDDRGRKLAASGPQPALAVCLPLASARRPCRRAQAQPAPCRDTRDPRLAGLSGAAGGDPLPKFAGLRTGLATVGGAFPASIRTRYSGSVVSATGGRTTGRALQVAMSTCAATRRVETRSCSRAGIRPTTSWLVVSASRSFAAPPEPRRECCMFVRPAVTPLARARPDCSNSTAFPCRPFA